MRQEIDKHIMTDTPLHLLKAFIKLHPTIRYLRLVRINYSNVSEMKTIPLYHALQIAEKANVTSPGDETPSTNGNEPIAGVDERGVVPGSPTYPSGTQLLIDQIGHANFSIFELIDLDGDDRLQIDWTTLFPITSDPECGFVMCSTYMTAACGQSGDGYERDPRQALKRIEAMAKSTYEIEFLIGHEIEFLLLDHSDLTKPLEGPKALYGNQFGWKGMTIVKEMVDSLEDAGVHVWSMHPEESTMGFFELQTMPLPPLRSCDEVAFVTHTIKSVAQKHGCVATLHVNPMPVGSPNFCVIGQHIHLSINRVEYQTQFLAGLIHHMPGLACILSASIEGYGTRLEGIGRRWVFWGYHKLCPLNQKSPGRWEIRYPDGHFNLYLQVCGLIIAGLDGIEKNLSLEQKEPIPGAVLRERGPLKDEVIKKYNLTTQYPSDLNEAIGHFEKQGEMDIYKAGMGDKVVQGLLLVLKSVWENRYRLDKEPRRLAILERI